MTSTMRSRYVAAISLAIAVVIGVNGLFSAARATGDPVFSGGSDVTGVVDSDVAITDLQVTGTGNPTVPVDLYVPSGTLSMATTTGLSFDTGTTGSHLHFSGALNDVNTALASLHYRTDRPKNIQLSATLSATDEVYNPDNDHIYQIVSGDISVTATQARTEAAAQTRYGLTGYLVTITSSTENSFIMDRANANTWIGATDADTEGVWKWDTGPEAGTQFWQGNGSGSAVGGRYNNWAGGEPNDSGENEDCGEFYAGNGHWNDLSCDGSTLSSYVIEYGSDGNLPAVPHKTINLAISYPTGETVNVHACSQLADIAADPVGYRYDTINITQDMDCGGATIDPMFLHHDSELGWIEFRGTLNGNHHTISNFVISTDSDATGLIGYTLDATIENLNLQSASITSTSSCVGGLIGRAEDTTLTSVYTDGVNVTGSVDTGGLVGCYNVYNDSHEISSSSVTSSTITADQYYAGGLVGYSEVEGATAALTENIVLANVIGQYNDAGGLVGELNASNEAQVTVASNGYGGAITTAGVAGGVIGYSDIDDATFTVNGNSVECGISATNSDGGILGELDVYSNGVAHVSENEVSAEMSVEEAAGGLIGYFYGEETENTEISANTVDVAMEGSDELAGLIGYMESYYTPGLTIAHNRMSGNITGSYDIGGLVGYGYLNGYDDISGPTSTLTWTDNAADMDIAADDGDVGGLIGYIETYYHLDLTVEQSSYTGTLIADGTAGGLIGDVYNESYDGDTAIHLLDSYANASVTGGNDVGGAVGYLDIYSEDGDSHAQFDMQRVYSIGSVSGVDYIGGLVGYIEQIDSLPTTITINNSFSAASIDTTDAAEYMGGLVGYFDQGDNHLTTAGNYYDATRTGIDTCTGWDGGIDIACTQVNVDSAQDNYFYAHTNQPMNHWNFTSIWGYNDDINDGFPCFQNQDGCVAAVDGDSDGIDNSIEADAPHSGDANNDGLADSAQANVTSFVNELTGHYTVLETSCDNNFNVQLGAEAAEGADAAYQYPLGLMGFVGRDCGEPGSSVTVTQYYFGDYDAQKYVMRKWDGDTNSYTTIDGAVLSNVTIGGQAAIKIQYTVVDGGPYDKDGAADGNITDPSGPGLQVVGAPNTGLQRRN